MSRLDLPAGNFAEIALDLKLYADSAHAAVAAGEIMVARGGWAGVQHTMTELQAAASMAGGLYEFFRAAAPFEEEIRDFLAGLAASRSLPEQTRGAA